MAEEELPEFAERAARPHGEENVKAENRRRQNERERDESFQEKFATPVREGEPARERQTEDEKNCGDAESQAEREQEGFHVQW